MSSDRDTYPEIGGGIFKCALKTFKQQLHCNLKNASTL